MFTCCDFCMQVVLDNVGLAAGLGFISELQYIWVSCVCVCVISQAKKKKQCIKEPPWISINTFTVIKHSSEIQLQSGRQFPLQSYVLLRASMGLGLTLIFLWLVRSGVCYSCKYFCVWGFEPGSSRQAEVHCLITVVRHSHRVAFPQPQPSCCTPALPRPSLPLTAASLAWGTGGGKDNSSYYSHLSATIAPSLFCPIWGKCPQARGIWCPPALTVSRSERTLQHTASQCHMLFYVWFDFLIVPLFCAILSISSRSLMFIPISNIITVYY